MSDVRALYEQVILDHNRSPRNFGVMDDPDRVVEAVNPLCGDAFTIYVKFEGDFLADIRFHGVGCAVSKSSASLMTTLLRGKPRDDANALFVAFHQMLNSHVGMPVDEEGLGKLRVFSGVREFPMRVKCATLAWHGLSKALRTDDGDMGEVTM